MKKKYKPESEDHKYFERLLNIRYWEVLDGRDPVEHWDLAEDNMSDNIVRIYAINWDEVRVLVDTLEMTHLDDDYTPDRRYDVMHYMDVTTRNIRLRDNTCFAP